jgi:hypothetical protein
VPCQRKYLYRAAAKVLKVEKNGPPLTLNKEPMESGTNGWNPENWKGLGSVEYLVGLGWLLRAFGVVP